MGDYYTVEFNLDLIRSRMPSVGGHPPTTNDVIHLLAERFERVADGWLVKSPDFRLFQRDEIVWARSVDNGEFPTYFTDSEPGVPSPPLVQRAANDEAAMRLKELPHAGQCLIPDFLIGDYRSVVVKSKPVIRRAVKGEAWHSATKEVNFTNIMQIDLPLVAVKGANRLSDAVNLVSFYDQLEESCLARDDLDILGHYTLAGTLLTSGLDHFWFCLCLCCSFGGGGILGPATEVRTAELRPIAVIALTKILNWWPYVCACHSRFVDSRGNPSPPRYWSEVGTLASHIGIPDAKMQLWQLSMDAAEERIRGWLEQA